LILLDTLPVLPGMGNKDQHQSMFAENEEKNELHSCRMYRGNRLLSSMCHFSKLKCAGKSTSSSKKAHALADRGYEECAHDRQFLMSNDEDTDLGGHAV
jgi:hypothetical protein